MSKIETVQTQSLFPDMENVIKEYNEEPNDGFITNREKVGTEEIYDNLSVYGEDVLQTKFPIPYDGLKDITRRIVWCSKDSRSLENFGEMMSSVGKLHVGGESSIYGAIIRQAQSFMVGNPLVTIQGKSGKYYNPGASAASRYLKACLSEFARDVFYSNVNIRTIPMVATKAFGSLEPKYFIPRIPMALVLGNLTVGYGFKSQTPMMDFEAVCDLVIAFSDHYQQKKIGIPPLNKVAKYIVPAFPINNLIRNKQEILAAYIRGDFNHTIMIDGCVELSGKNIVLRTVPYGTDFNTVMSSIREVMRDSKHWLWDHLTTVNDFSADEAEFSLELKRGQNPFEVLEKMRSILRFTTNLTPIHSYIKNERVITLPPLTLVYLWYQERMMSIAGGLKYKLADLINKRMISEAMLIICDRTDEVIDIIRNSDDEETAVTTLHTTFEDLTWRQAEVIAAQRISILAKSKRTVIQEEINQLNIEIDNTNASFGKIHQTIHSDASWLKKKYKSTNESKYSCDFMGHVRFGHWGISHFFTIDEMYDLLNSKGWPTNMKKYIVMYGAAQPLNLMIKRGIASNITTMAKDIHCERLIPHRGELNQKVLMIDSENRACIVEGMKNGVREDITLCPITNNFYGIHKNGTVTLESVDKYPVRKAMHKGDRINFIYGLADTCKDMVVFHMNTKDPNTLRIDRILTGANSLGKVKTIAMGKTSILGAFPIDTEKVYLDIPSDCIKNNSMEHLLVINMKNIFKEGPHVVMNLSRSGNQLKRNPNVRSLYTWEL